MVKTEKELAFLRDLYIDEHWTKRFTDLLDKHISLSTEENFLYVNAGTGNHALFLREKIKSDIAVFATCENSDLLAIASDKAAAVKSDIDFSMLEFEHGSFDAVLADATFVPHEQISAFISNCVRVARKGAKVLIFAVSAGSFGEIFSMLWEVLVNEDLGAHGAAAEEMVTGIRTVSELETLAKTAGLRNVATETSNEVFEYDNGADFVGSSLAGDFLLPGWLNMLNDKEKARVTAALAKLIDAEDGSLTFRFSVKATLLTGEKA